jgi:hypothetical protein
MLLPQHTNEPLGFTHTHTHTYTHTYTHTLIRPARRAFGGVAGWDGEGSPLQETSEAITHHVVDRPVQGHRFLTREYVKPQVGLRIYKAKR